jgi:hypothetical protein
MLTKFGEIGNCPYPLDTSDTDVLWKFSTSPPKETRMTTPDTLVIPAPIDFDKEYRAKLRQLYRFSEFLRSLKEDDLDWAVEIFELQARIEALLKVCR